MHTVVEKVLQTVKQHQLIDPHDHIYVALSGGADSVCLLHVLILLKNELQIDSITALHLHHGLRGEAADRDERFVSQLCSAMSIPLITKRVDTSLEAQRFHESVEEAGRRLRYTFFDEAVGDDERAKIATAHHADDRIETMLFNMIRGSGMKGLSGIPIRRERIIRPLHSCHSDDIHQFCYEMHISYVTDETNEQLVFSRNRIRHQVIPLLQSIHPGATKNLERLSSIAMQEDLYLDEIARKKLDSSKAESDNVYFLKCLNEESEVIERRALRIAAIRAGCSSVENYHINEMLNVLHNFGRCNIPNRIIFECDGDYFRFIHPFAKCFRDDEELVLPYETRFSFKDMEFQTAILTLGEYQQKKNVHKNLSNLYISCDMIKGDLFLRTRREGDRFRPQKRGCTKSLKKWFSEKKIEPSLRDTIPLLCDDDGILAIIGYEVDERATVTCDTQKILFLNFIKKKDCDYLVDA